MPIQPLIDIISQMTDVYQEMLQLSEQKTAIIVSNDVESLNKIVGKEIKLIKRVTELDQQRVEAVSQYLIDKGYRPHPYVTVTDIAKLVFKAEEKRMLQDAQRKLVEVVDRLKVLNERNQQLIQHSLAFITYSLDLIAGPDENDAVYQNPTQQQYTNKRISMFDTRA